MIDRDERARELGQSVARNRQMVFEFSFWRLSCTDDVTPIADAIEESAGAGVTLISTLPMKESEKVRLIARVKASGVITSVTFWRQLTLTSDDASRLLDILKEVTESAVEAAADRADRKLTEWSSPNIQKLRGSDGKRNGKKASR